jgi:hypothetical protein
LLISIIIIPRSGRKYGRRKKTNRQPKAHLER